MVLLCLAAGEARADTLDIDVHGIKNPLLDNVESRLAGYEIDGDTPLSEARLERMVEDVAAAAEGAVRPFGFYHATIRTELSRTGDGRWELDVHVDRGPPVKVATARIDVHGPGTELPELEDWRDDWPLKPGKRLNQETWKEEKQAAMDLAETHGYLNAAFTEHRIAIDLERNQADLVLVLDTGQRAVFGDIRYEQEAVKPEILDNLSRFDEGQPYDAWLVERFRLDLWRTGYYDEIEVIEERRLEENPPSVNLVVTANTRNLNTYTGSLGFGTDTGVRAQVSWQRHLLSSRGDSLETGLGWQQTNSEFSFRSNYKLPRRTREEEYWTADLFVRRENQDLEVRPDGDDEDFVTLANGDVIDYSIRAGRLIVRDMSGGYQQLFENWYVQFVLEDNTFGESQLSLGPDDQTAERDIQEFDAVDNSIAVGVNWDWPVIRGQAFRTVGHHERAWVFTANEAWGSGKDFTQAYVSSSYHRLLGDRFKLLLRGEVGWSDARVEDFEVDLGDRTLELSLTDLPNLYRFKAGGSRSVRGYAFESLSNNGLGSNNIVTASAEIEMNVRKDWSVAAFYDVGNAFNSWSDFDLRRGIGVGVRWYSIIGAVRVDVAQALDFAGDPWRIHFTIGTPLL